MQNQKIVLEHVDFHNLNIDYLEIPLNKLVVVTGTSGSGKTSLIYDTLATQAQALLNIENTPKKIFGTLNEFSPTKISGATPIKALKQKFDHFNKAFNFAQFIDVSPSLNLLFSRLSNHKTLKAYSTRDIFNIAHELEHPGEAIYSKPSYSNRYLFTYPLYWKLIPETMVLNEQEKQIVDNNTIKLINQLNYLKIKSFLGPKTLGYFIVNGKLVIDFEDLKDELNSFDELIETIDLVFANIQKTHIVEDSLITQLDQATKDEEALFKKLIAENIKHGLSIQDIAEHLNIQLNITSPKQKTAQKLPLNNTQDNNLKGNSNSSSLSSTKTTDKDDTEANKQIAKIANLAIEQDQIKTLAQAQAYSQARKQQALEQMNQEKLEVDSEKANENIVDLSNKEVNTLRNLFNQNIGIYSPITKQTTRYNLRAFIELDGAQVEFNLNSPTLFNPMYSKFVCKCCRGRGYIDGKQALSYQEENFQAIANLQLDDNESINKSINNDDESNNESNDESTQQRKLSSLANSTKATKASKIKNSTKVQAQAYGFNEQELDMLTNTEINNVFADTKAKKSRNSSKTPKNSDEEPLDEEVTCPVCHGIGFEDTIADLELFGKTFREIHTLPIRHLLDFFNQQLQKEKRLNTDKQINLSKAINIQELKIYLLSDIIARLKPFVEIGLGYIHLARNLNSLSGGEIQRSNLVKVISNKTTNVTYILDEPSIGLHPNDNNALLQKIKQIIDYGNSVIIIEHDSNFIKNADHLIILDNGRVSFQGTINELEKTELPLAKYLRGELFISQRISELNNKLNKLDLFELQNNIEQDSLKFIVENTNAEINPNLNIKTLNKQAQKAGLGLYQYLSCFNAIELLKYDMAKGITFEKVHKGYFKNQDVYFKSKMINVITGISGSGKSTLGSQVINKSLRVLLEVEQKFKKLTKAQKRQMLKLEFGVNNVTGILDGHENKRYDNVIYASQKPKNTSKTILDYIETTSKQSLIWCISQIFKAEAKRQFPKANLKDSDFRLGSISKANKCPTCEGKRAIEFNFGDFSEFIECQDCQGTGFNQKVLAITLAYDDKSEVKYNIDDFYKMNVDTAYDFFFKYHQRYGSKECKNIIRLLGLLKRFRLNSLILGQSIMDCSGGEIQRLHIVRELARQNMKNKNFVIILDEPTTGLHFNDIQSLLDFLVELKDLGHTIIVIEHNLDFIYNADHLVELGHGADIEGGEVIFSGSISELLETYHELQAKKVPITDKRYTPMMQYVDEHNTVLKNYIEHIAQV